MMHPEEKAFALSMVNLSSNPDFQACLAWLKGNAFWDQGPFDAANFEPIRASHIEGRQSMIRLIEIEIETAKYQLGYE